MSFQPPLYSSYLLLLLLIKTVENLAIGDVYSFTLATRCLKFAYIVAGWPALPENGLGRYLDKQFVQVRLILPTQVWCCMPVDPLRSLK